MVARFIVCLLGVAFSLTVATAQDKPDAKKPATEATTTDKESKPAESEQSAEEDSGFDLSMVPAGQPVKGLKIPFYAADGVTLQMTFEADEARRIDDTTIELQNLQIDAAGEDEKKFLVQMPQSVFNIESRMLTGENGVLIKRDDFEIRGREAEFDIKKRFGKVIGNVQMIIYSTEQFE